jgi:hypothetical protein
VGHLCPHCKEYHCTEHHQPANHACPSHKQANFPPVKPSYTPEISGKPQATSVSIEKIQNKFFLLTFTLVMIEEILRLISYSMHSPYLESNIYVAVASLQVTPYLSSSIMFLLACLVLLATHRVAKNQDTRNEYVNLLKKTAPFGIYVAIVIITLVSIANRTLILLT